MSTPFSSTPAEILLVQLAQKLRENGYHFITSTPLTHARVNARKENAWAKNLRDVFGWSRPFQREVLPDEIWNLMNAAQIVEAHENGFRSTLRLSSLGENLFWHSAFPTSQSDAVFFGPDTYRFASAIESWIGGSRRTPRRAVDLCSGSGVGAILMAARLKNAKCFRLISTTPRCDWRASIPRSPERPMCARNTAIY